MEYKEGPIENIYFAYHLYGYIHAWIRIYSRSVRSFCIHGANSPCCVGELSVFLDMVNIKLNIELRTVSNRYDKER